MNENQTVELTPEFLEQYSVLSFAISLIVLGMLTGSLASWTYLIVRAIRRQPLLAVEPSAPRVWGLADVMLIAITTVVCQIVFASAYVRIAGRAVPENGDAQLSAAVATAASLGNVAAIALALGWLAVRFNVTPAHAGFRTQGWWRQLQIGVVATLAALPVVYLLMAVVSIGLRTEYSHPLLDEVRRNATLGSYLLGVVTAVLLAPLAEEFLFRVLIQGWLQSWAVSTPRQILFGADLADRNATIHAAHNSAWDDNAWDVQAELVDAPLLTPHLAGTTDLASPNPYAVPLSSQAGEVAVDSGAPDDSHAQFIPPVWPSIVTGILFGLAHWGYGLSFVPLIVLGILLGLLYRATNSIWPCFLVHFALNGSSMLLLGLSILVERSK